MRLDEDPDDWLYDAVAAHEERWLNYVEDRVERHREQRYAQAPILDPASHRPTWAPTSIGELKELADAAREERDARVTEILAAGVYQHQQNRR